MKVRFSQLSKEILFGFPELVSLLVRGVHRVVLRVLQHPHPDSGAPAPYPDSEKLK